MNKYSVTVEAFGQIRVMKVEALTIGEAIRKGSKACGIKVEAKVEERNGVRVAYLDGEEIEIS